MKYRRADLGRALLLCVLAAGMAGCADFTKGPGLPPAAVPKVNSYVAVATEKLTTANGGLSSGYTLTLDHSASLVDQEDVSGGSPIPISGGTFSASNGFLSAALNPYDGAVLTSPEVGNWLLEEQGIMGFAYISAPNTADLLGKVSGPEGQGDTSQNLIPFVSNADCPNVSKEQTYQYLTFPGNVEPHGWDFRTDVAYGTFQIATLQSGAIVNLTAIRQYLLPGADVNPGTAVSANPGPTDISGSCGLSAAGNLISISYVDPLGVPHYAEVNLTDGFLLESNIGFGVENQGISNVLGAGYGAMGLLQPSAALAATSLAGDSYQGFVHVPDNYTVTSAFSGAAATSSACGKFRASLNSLSTKPSANAIYGGEYAGNDPSTAKTSNCDMAIDLGAQDAKNNGLFPSATIYIGSAFPLNNPSRGTGTGKAYSFPAIAIAGAISGHNAIFVLAQDTVAGLGHAVAIELLHAQ